MSGDPAVEVRGLRKQYGSRPVVDDISFSVARGEVLALLGPNGAGKTTTIEILEGYRRRDGGEVRVLGHDPEREAHRLRRRIGLMLQEGGIYPQARPREIVALFAHFYPKPLDIDEVLRLVGLAGLRTPYRRLSGGQKQRLALALALVGRPELVFLDEPTAGMDPQARRATWEIVRDLRAQGVTVLLTTHAMEEAESLADQIAIIDHGRLVALGELIDLRGGDGHVVRLLAAPDLPLDELRGLASVQSVRQAEPGIYLFDTTDPPALLVAITTWAQRRAVMIRELRVGAESLEEVFLRLTGPAMRD